MYTCVYTHTHGRKDGWIYGKDGDGGKMGGRRERASKLGQFQLYNQRKVGLFFSEVP